jgi:putative flippase GtrA
MIVGGVVGLITVGIRILIGRWLGADTPIYYSLSVVLAYAVGIALSFSLNRQFTFRGDNATYSWSHLSRFVAIAVLGMILTWLFSLALRYGLRLEALIGHHAATTAFVAAALLSSAITYPLNARLVFGRRTQLTTPETP